MGGRATYHGMRFFRGALAALSLACALAPAASAQDSRKKQEIIFPELPPRVVGDAPFRLIGRATSGLPVAFELVAGPAVLDGKILKLTNVPGLVIIRASQAGNDTFLPAPPVEHVFVVGGRPAAPEILSQPSGTRAGIGDFVLLSVEASGEPQPSFQWRKDGAPISGATDKRLTIVSATAPDAGDYDVVASNSQGAATSNRARVTVGRRSQMISFEGSTSAVAGQTVMLTANASSGLPVRFDVISGQAIINGPAMTCSQGGSVVVQASQAGDTNYEAAVPVTRTFFVNAGLNGPHIQ
jgi:hypothetical protein